MQKISNIISLVKPFYPGSDPAHDWAHVERVAANARLIAQGLEVDLPCLLAAVYCHDLVNLPKDHPERKNASTLAAEKAGPLLASAGYSTSEIHQIQQYIIEHSFSKGLKPSSLEASILQDADRLDALGAIGILRCAAVNTQMKSSFYHLEDPFARARELNDREFMLDHYSVKLFKLPELMNTPNAKKEAASRVEFMRQFLEVLGREVEHVES
jgi:uncharacterized protein